MWGPILVQNSAKCLKMGSPVKMRFFSNRTATDFMQDAPGGRYANYKHVRLLYVYNNPTRSAPTHPRGSLVFLLNFMGRGIL